MSDETTNSSQTAAPVSRAWLSDLRDKLYSLETGHLVVDEDNWYSCPASGNCIRDHDGGCNCGADRHNATLRDCLALLDNALSCDDL